jgi:hypothetical protein
MPIDELDEFDVFDQREERSDLAIADLIARDEPKAPPAAPPIGQPVFGEQADFGEPEQYSEAEGIHGEFVEVEIVHEEFGFPSDAAESGLDDVDEPSVLEGELADTPEGQGERPGGRRRRRRRGGRRGRRGRSAQESDSRDETADADAPADEFLGEGSESAEIESSSAAEPEAEEGLEERKGRRRRRRGRGGKRGDREPRSKRGPRSVDDQGEQDEVSADDNDIVDEDHRGPAPQDAADFAEDADSDEIGVGSDKNSHRAIPSWEEAIGVIIATNMEARARSPHERPPRGRGRRGRGQSRGH